MERNLVSDKEKEKFGKGSVHGLAAPETANNAACSGAFVPLLTFRYSWKWNYCCNARCSFRFWYSTRSKTLYDLTLKYFGQL
jgi:hypothetical protein